MNLNSSTVQWGEEHPSFIRFSIMKTSHRLLAIAAALGLAVSSASAAFVLPIVFSGPGGTGSDGLTSGNLTEPRLTFTSMNFIDVTMSVDSAGTYNFNQAPSFGGTLNNTGVTWTGFKLAMQAGGVGTFTSPWQDSPGFAQATVTPNSVVFPTENVPSGTSFAFFGNFTTTGPGTVIIRETPVPEPSSFVLAGLGALALGLARRRASHPRQCAG